MIETTWIKTSEQMPEEAKFVNVLFDNGKVEEAKFHFGEWIFSGKSIKNLKIKNLYENRIFSQNIISWRSNE